MSLKVKVQDVDGQVRIEEIDLYCAKLSKKNNSVLYKIENYIGKNLLTEEELAIIRNIILDVSADIQRLPYSICEGDSDERL